MNIHGYKTKIREERMIIKESGKEIEELRNSKDYDRIGRLKSLIESKEGKIKRFKTKLKKLKAQKPQKKRAFKKRKKER